MAGSVNHISNQIFKTIKGFGHTIVLFTDEGKKTIDPEEARRFYAKDIMMMVHLSASDTTSELTVNLSKDTNIEEIKPMLSSLRKLANKHIVEYTVKTYGKKIQPKDFAYQAKTAGKGDGMNMNEGFSGWHGSAKKSINELDDAKIIVRHKKIVDEGKRGARTRQIESIFIENSEGERFKFPSTNVTAAKAMLRHVKEGGVPFDDFGQHIYTIMEELNHLKVFQRRSRKDQFFEDASIINEIDSRIGSLRKNLKQIAGIKGYKKHFESFEKKEMTFSREKLSELANTMTAKCFDESLAGSLPYVAKIIENYRTRQDHESVVVEFAQYIMDNKDNIKVRVPLDAGDDDVLGPPWDSMDVENPAYQSYSDPVTEIAAWVTFISPRLVDDKLANLLMRMSDAVYEGVGQKYIMMAKAAIKVIRQRAKVTESNTPNKRTGIVEREIDMLNKTFEKYSTDEIFY